MSSVFWHRTVVRRVHSQFPLNSRYPPTNDRKSIQIRNFKLYADSNPSAWTANTRQTAPLLPVSCRGSCTHGMTDFLPCLQIFWKPRPIGLLHPRSRLVHLEKITTRPSSHGRHAWLQAASGVRALLSLPLQRKDGDSTEHPRRKTCGLESTQAAAPWSRTTTKRPSTPASPPPGANPPPRPTHRQRCQDSRLRTATGLHAVRNRRLDKLLRFRLASRVDSEW